MTGKNFLVVGARTGIGRELTQLLSNEGHHVIAVSREAGDLESLQNVDFIAHDVTSEEAFNLDVDALDGVAYCPGTINLKPFHRLSPTDFQNDLVINVLGAVKIIQSVLPQLKKSANASIVLFSTVAVQQGMSFHSSVGASKGAVEGLSRALAAELSPSIRVNCIAPSVTKTPLAERLLSTPEKEEASGKRHPLQRVGRPEDVARSAAFLLSDDSEWITGQVLGVDGGMSAVKML